jgi:uncharacterized membrane protein
LLDVSVLGPVDVRLAGDRPAHVGNVQTISGKMRETSDIIPPSDMAADWQRRMDSWLEAGVIDKETAARILRFESQNGPTLRSRWPVLMLFGLGALLVGAGLLLFISAHWDALSPLQRMSLVVTLVAGFHLTGAWFASRFGVLATTFHALGTIALGAGILLTGQIFNLAERWPSGMLLLATASCAIGRSSP